MVLLLRQPPIPEQGDKLELPRQEVETLFSRRRAEFDGPDLGRPCCTSKTW